MSNKNKNTVLLQHIYKRKQPATISKALKKERLSERNWHRIWLGANTLGLIFIGYMIYIFFIRG